jgi:hypothetical protein
MIGILAILTLAAMGFSFLPGVSGAVAFMATVALGLALLVVAIRRRCRREAQLSVRYRRVAAAANVTTAAQAARKDILRAAASFTSDRADSARVTANAAPLLAWVEAAGEGQDAALRAIAIEQRFMNLVRVPRDDRPQDDPEEFLAGAKILHSFMADGLKDGAA